MSSLLRARAAPLLVPFVVLLVQGALVQVLPAQTFHERVQLYASDAERDDRFGQSVAVDGDTLAIGAHGDEGYRGAVYVFVRAGTGWTQQAKLVASDGTWGEYFGVSVALSGDTLVVGADHDEGDESSPYFWAGAVYVFVRDGTTWTQQAKLRGDDTDADDRFGGSVAVEGDTLIVGASYKTFPGFGFGGSAYVFTRVGTAWTQQAHLFPSDALAHAQEHSFGSSVALSGDTAAVGEEPGAFVQEESAVSVFVRSGTTWSEQARLRAADLTHPQDRFGGLVAISGDCLAISCFPAAGDDAVYVFERTGTSWTQQAKLQALDWMPGDEFGRPALAGDRLVVGAGREDHYPGGAVAGAAYLYQRSGSVWTLKSKLVASDSSSNDSFGNSLGFGGTTIVVGSAINSHSGGQYQGSAYVFEPDPGPGPLLGTVTPTTFDALIPGTEQTIALGGSDLDLTLSLLVDGTPIDPARYTIVGPELITLDMPPVDVSAFHPSVWIQPLLHGLRAVGTENSDEVQVRALVPPGPRYELGSGDPFNVVDRDAGLAFVLAGRPGSRHAIYSSLSNVPSPSGVVTLDIGNNFAQLCFSGVHEIPSVGWRRVVVPAGALHDPGAAGITFYSQTIDLTRPLPYAVSNLQSIQLVR